MSVNFLLIFLSPILSADTVWCFFSDALEIKLRDHSTTVAETGEVFLLNMKKGSVIKLSQDGEFMLEFSQHGDAPGEMGFPTRIHVYDNTVYVYDRRRKSMHLFDMNGDFKKEQNFGGYLAELVKTKNGWLSYANFRRGRLSGHSQLKWHNESFEEEYLLAQLEPDHGEEDVEKQRSRGYLPAKDRIHFGVADQGEKVVVIHPGHQVKITIHDGSNGQVLQTIESERKPVPYDEAWARETIDNYILKTKKFTRAKRPVAEPEFPDFFPFAKRLFVFDDGTFHIVPWQGQEGSGTPILSFDMEGHPLPNAFTCEALRHIVHLTPTHGFVAFYDKESKQGGIAKVTRSKLASFVLPELPANPNSQSQ